MGVMRSVEVELSASIVSWSGYGKLVPITCLRSTSHGAEGGGGSSRHIPPSLHHIPSLSIMTTADVATTTPAATDAAAAAAATTQLARYPSLKGKVAVVTGGARGIGKSIALTLAASGAHVVINYVSDASNEKAAALVHEIKALGSDAIAVQADVSYAAGAKTLIDATVAHFSHIDILVNNAGMLSMGMLEDISEDTYDLVFRVNTKSVFLTTQAASPHIRDNGRVVCITTGSNRTAHAYTSAYGASKSAVESLARAWASEVIWGVAHISGALFSCPHAFMPALTVTFSRLVIQLGGKRKITVNSVSPGNTETDMYNNVVSQFGPAIKVKAANETLLKRIAVPQDIANITAFLCSSDGEWITAQTIQASGGRFIAV
ncbi:hypothetical protein HDU87_000641 [Geranomyces variabilis]|uniref:Ketoreductase domain-containing protein n=1 Tax=Geranomyces variabilis TaxID=109894 RepID=A0AAD5THE4_9FUNG|nr:hypothetical protein HDU87_000641 [Geranomyces variabilis]